MNELTDTAHLRVLERAYSRLVFETMPVLASHRRPAIRGQLVLIDALEPDGPVLRYVPAPSPVDDDDVIAEIRGMANEITSMILEDLRAAGHDGSTPAEVRDAVALIREKLAFDDIPPDALTWALEERVQPLDRSLAHRLVANGLSADRWHVIPEYVQQAGATGGTSTFEPLVGELLACTWDLAPDEITEERIACIHLALIPFRALGAVRGFVALHLFRDEVDEVEAQVRERDVADALETLFSSSVIDVFTAWFMRRVGKLTALGGTGAAQVSETAFRYLYPCSALRFHPPGQDPPGDTAGVRSLTFRGDPVRRFLGISGVSWDLLYPDLPEDDPSGDRRRRVDAYHELIEVKLHDLALQAASEMDRQYGRLLGVFGHHSGSLFKASGAFQLWASCARGEDPDRLETKQVLDRLLPVWGISQAISLVQKQDDDGGLTVPPDWIDPDWLARDDLGGHVVDAVIALTRYVFENAGGGEPFLPWELERPDGTRERWVWGEGGDAAWLKSLPPFRDDPIIFDKTLAVTIGLFEMANNLRKYPPALGWGRSVRRALAKLDDAERRVDVRVRTDDQAVSLTLEQPVLLQSDGSVPTSKSLARIRIFEYQCLRGLVATGEPERCSETRNPRIVRIRGTWTYRWSDLLDVFRRTHGA